jgi:hypothetical protein
MPVVSVAAATVMAPWLVGVVIGRAGGIEKQTAKQKRDEAAAAGIGKRCAFHDFFAG